MASSAKYDVHIRDVANATDDATSEAALIQVIEDFGLEGRIVLVQPTSPFTTVTTLRAMNFVPLPALTVRAAHPQIWREDGTPLLGSFPRVPRQKTTPVYVETGGAYAMDCARLLETGDRFHDLPVSFVEVGAREALQVDDETELVLMNEIDAGRTIRGEKN